MLLCTEKQIKILKMLLYLKKITSSNIKFYFSVHIVNFLKHSNILILGPSSSGPKSPGPKSLGPNHPTPHETSNLMIVGSNPVRSISRRLIYKRYRRPVLQTGLRKSKTKDNYGALNCLGLVCNENS